MILLYLLPILLTVGLNLNLTWMELGIDSVRKLFISCTSRSSVTVGCYLSQIQITVNVVHFYTF